MKIFNYNEEVYNKIDTCYKNNTDPKKSLIRYDEYD